MIIQPILCAVLIVCAFYGWRQRRLSPFIGIVMPLACTLGIVLVLEPALATHAAVFVGVGRGADLILYLWTIISVLLIAQIHFKLRVSQANVTLLAREVALLRAEFEWRT